MDIERIWRQLQQIKQWYHIGETSKRGENEEILKPLNKLINFQTRELIIENNFHF